MKIDLGLCSIRPLLDRDAESIAANANDRGVWIHLRDGFPHPYTIEDAISYLRLIQQEEDSLSFAIDIGGVAVGGIAAFRQDDVHRFCVEIGYWIGRDFWGKGVMTKVVNAFTDYLLETRKFHRVFAVPYSNHPASDRVLEKAGFLLEGVLRSSAVKDGKLLDQHLYAKVAAKPKWGIKTGQLLPG